MSSASFWNVIYNGLRIGGNIITLPLALRMLPANEMGLFYTFGAVAGIAMFMDLGMGATVSRQATYIYSGAKHLTSSGIPESSEDGKTDIGLFSRFVSTVRKIYTIIGFITGILLIIPGGIFISKSIIASGMSAHFIFAWIIYACAASHSLATGFWSNFLMGIKEERLSAVIGVYAQLGYILLVIIGLVCGIGIWSYTIALLASGVSQRTISKYYFVLKSKVSDYLKADFRMLKVFWPMSWRLWIVLISMYVFQKASVIISSKQLGLEVTAGYGLALSLFSIVYQVTSTPLFVAYPGISRLRVMGNYVGIRSIFLKRLYCSMAICGLALVGIIFIGPYFLTLAGSHTHLPTKPLLLMAALFFLCDKHQGEYFSLVLSENQNPFIIPYAMTAVLSIALMALGATYWGLFGLILGQGVSQTAINNWWVVVRGWKGLEISQEKNKT